MLPHSLTVCQEYINKECATLIWEVNMALAKDDVRSRYRLVVNIIKVVGNHVNEIHELCKQLNFSRLGCLCRRRFALHFACLPIDIEHGKF